MNPIVLSALIGAGANLAGGFFGTGSSAGLSQQDQRFLADWNMKKSDRDEAYQHQLAEHGITMRVQDAAEAGLSPLAAMGVAPMGGSPTAMVPMGPPESKGPSPWGKALSDMGQNVSRSLLATATQDTRDLNKANIKKAQAEADYAEDQAILSHRKVTGVDHPNNPPLPRPPLHIEAIDDNGKVISVINPDLAMSLNPDIISRWGDIQSTMFRNIFGEPSYPFWGHIKESVSDAVKKSLFLRR